MECLPKNKIETKLYEYTIHIEQNNSEKHFDSTSHIDKFIKNRTDNFCFRGNCKYIWKVSIV